MTDTSERERRVMFNARRIIKRTTMSNAELYSELFGTGMGTAIKRCREMGISPDAAAIGKEMKP